jgi:hypothetical protein
MVAIQPKRPTINTIEEAIEFLTRHAKLFVSGLMDRWWVRSKDENQHNILPKPQFKLL